MKTSIKESFILSWSCDANKKSFEEEQKKKRDRLRPDEGAAILREQWY